MRDFTQVGKPESNKGAPAPALARARQIIVKALYGSALMFAAAGIWLLIGEQNFFPQEISPILGGAFLVTALMDVAAVAIMKKIWERDIPR